MTTGPALFANLERVLLGKREALRIVSAAALGGGHVLIEDEPGVGKTVLAKAVARSFAVESARVQGSVDLLPSDVTGVSVFDPSTTSWSFRPGPVFHHVLVIDEINRATPRSQAALLEAMAERQATVDGVTYPLPVPFFVIATQNPEGDVGTFALPAGQRDRFAVSVSLGLPDAATERRILRGEGGEASLRELTPIASADEWRLAQGALESIHVSDPVLDYALAVVAATRVHPDLAEGASPRAGQVLIRMARALAAIEGRSYALPDDVQRAAPYVLAHRLRWRAFERTRLAHSLAEEVVRTVPVP